MVKEMDKSRALPSPPTGPQETIKFDVIESEKEIVQFAAGKPLGGD
jgi:hypothetical protein